MKATLTRRQGLWLALAATVVACGWAASQGDAASQAEPMVAPARARPVAQQAQAATAASAKAGIGASLRGWPRLDAVVPVPAEWRGTLRPEAWGRPPPPPLPSPPPRAAVAPPMVAAPPPPPQAPPFPYTLIGRFDDGQQPQALLSHPLRTVGVKAQEVIDGQWRVDAVQAQGLSLTWLPTGQRLTLSYTPS